MNVTLMYGARHMTVQGFVGVGEANEIKSVTNVSLLS
jgi:hypothetical protein